MKGEREKGRNRGKDREGGKERTKKERRKEEKRERKKKRREKEGDPSGVPGSFLSLAWPMKAIWIANGSVLCTLAVSFSVTLSVK